MRQEVAENYQSVYANDVVVGASPSTYDMRLVFFEVVEDSTADQMVREKKVRVVMPIVTAIALFKMLEKAIPDLKKMPIPTMEIERL